MTKLHQFLESRQIRQGDFALQIETTQPTVSRLARGEATPSLELAVKIARVTGGAVPVDSWVPPESSDGDASARVQVPESHTPPVLQP